MLYAASASALVLDDSSVLRFCSSIAEFLGNSVKEISGVYCWDSSRIIADRANPCLGLAHGNVGTALALAVYAKASRQESYLNLAQKVLLSTFENGKDIHNYQIRIALNEDQAPDPPHYWCRGLGGLLWASLQIFKNSDQRFFPMRDWLVARILSSEPAGNISYCHGLGGRLELLRMIQHISIYASKAKERIHSLERHLYRTSVYKDGKVTWHTEDIGQFSDELWLGGLAGATSLAMLTADHGAPLISPEFFSILTSSQNYSSRESA